MSACLEGLNEVQKEAVTHRDGPLLVLAGAGSGKTRVITSRIAYLLEKGWFAPEQILAVTFTNKAAREMSDRVGRIFGDQSSVLIKTFHSFCAWLLRRNAEAAGLSPYFNIYDDDDSYDLLKALMPRLPGAELKMLHRGISKAKDAGWTPEDVPPDLCSHPEFAQAFQAYEAKLYQTGNVDFPGLILRAVNLLENNEALRRRIRQRFPCILVDEFQDTNRVQYNLLAQLWTPETWLCVVGDDDQSIYRFRGAEVRNILDFPQSFPGTKVIRLEENYRSTGHILAIASEVVAHNQGRLGKTLWTRQPEGKKPEIHLLEDQEDEARFVAGLIKASPGVETAILYRTNAQSRSFETLFSKERIPYRIVGSTRFYDREEVKDVLAFLFFLSNPKDEVSFRRIINKPARGIGPAALTALMESPGNDLSEKCLNRESGLKGKAKAALGHFNGLLRDLREIRDTRPLPELIHETALRSGLIDYHRSQDENLGSGKVENLEELVNAGAGFPAGPQGLTDFLERVELEGGEAAVQGQEEARTVLITMHNTKGLEFDRVILTGLEEGLFPREDEDEEEIEEQRRLFYVGITRARKELYFTSCRKRFFRGQFFQQDPSRFLLEVPQDRVETKGTVKKKQEFIRGTGVYHEDYGTGTVVSSWYNGPEYVIKVQFESGRSAIFLPAYTPLEKVAFHE